MSEAVPCESTLRGGKTCRGKYHATIRIKGLGADMFLAVCKRHLATWRGNWRFLGVEEDTPNV